MLAEKLLVACVIVIYVRLQIRITLTLTLGVQCIRLSTGIQLSSHVSHMMPKMAAVRTEIFCLLLVFAIFWFDGVDSVHVMEQDGACNQIEGTWRINEKNGHEVFFSIKKNGQYLDVKFPKKITGQPFETSAKKTDGDNIIYTIEPAEFMKSVKSSHEIDDDKCSITLTDDTVLTQVATIKKVHLIFMNHLDVGYNTNHYYPGTNRKIPGFITNVLNFYFQVYFPRAARLGDQLREIRAKETFTYTTHPWLINLYLDCPDITLSGVKLQCPTAQQLDTFRRAVWMGDIAWHAAPLNLEPESSNPDLYSYSLTLSRDLDEYFGLKKTARTASNRDVPGYTKAAIPYLVENGIEALSVGVNPLSPPPAVPSPHVWTFQGKSIIAYWHKGGYPLMPGPSPQHPGGLSRKDCQFVKGLNQVMCFAFRRDNFGPPDNITEIMGYYKILRYEFPDAEIKASTFEEFTKVVLPLKKTLPVVTDEIGDTWIQGPASDPVKMAYYRTINRLRSKCLKEKRCDLKDKRVNDMSRLLVKLPEHTYGIADSFDFRNWSNKDFLPLQHDPSHTNFVNDTKSWISQRYFTNLTVNALKDHPLAKEIEEELQKLIPYVPDLSKYEYHPSSKPIMCKNGMKLKVGPDGGLTQMTDAKGREWADDKNPLAKIMYRTYNSSDFDSFVSQYSYNGGNVGIKKPNLDKFAPGTESKFWPSPMRGVMVSKDDPCQEIYVRIITLDAEAWWKYGAPPEYMLKYSVPDASTVDIEYQFYSKPSTRMPESLLLSFQPTPKPGHDWYLHKIGYLVDPTHVVANGSQYVHAIDEGVAYFDSNKKGMFVESLDVATVLLHTSTRDPSPFPTPLRPFNDKITGMSFNIYNNIWETNFIFWYPFQPQDKHFKARFRLKFT